jgi:hypothetical protein
MRRQLYGVGLILLIAGLLVISGNSFTAHAQDERCFPETGHCISGVIRSYWEQNGGLSVFGYPISRLSVQTVEDWSGPVQWFERDRLEDHSADGQGVLAGRLGARLLEKQGRPWQSFEKVDGAPAGCRYFPETGHSMCEPFLSYWNNNGGLERFGYPITEPMEETIGNWTGTVQYCERRRMEHHPENQGTQYEVLLGLLGNAIYTGDVATTGGKIAYTSTQGGEQDIWVMDANGTNAYNVTNNPASGDFQADWSPDGSQLVFVRGTEVTQNQDIWIINADGTGARQLTDNPAADWGPAWSSDGTKIAFASDRNGTQDIFIRNADGSGEDYNLTGFAPDTSEYAPAWSPDSTRIAYISDEGGTPDIWIITMDGSERYNLTNDQYQNYDHPVWTSDSTRIVFDYKGTYSSATPSIGYITTDRASRQDITSTYGGFHPAVSPDNGSVAYEGSDGDIYVINVNGSGKKNLTNSENVLDREPAWYP